ncbi:MAG: TfoX/Sxy family protein [Chloroflexota bacterium]
MPYDAHLAERVRVALSAEPGLTEMRMFGGIGFLINGNMTCGVHGAGLIVRVGAEAYADALAQPGARVFDMTGRPMRGWVLVDPPGCATDDALRAWVARGAAQARALPAKG